jgi:hypothetical protein
VQPGECTNMMHSPRRIRNEDRRTHRRPGTFTRRMEPSPPSPARPTPAAAPARCLAHARTTATPQTVTSLGKEMHDRSGSDTETSAKPEEAMKADVAAQRHHANAAQQEVEQSALRLPNASFTTLWTRNSHSQQSPENAETWLGRCSNGGFRHIQCCKMLQSPVRPCCWGDTNMMLQPRQSRNQAG